MNTSFLLYRLKLVTKQIMTKIVIFIVVLALKKAHKTSLLHKLKKNMIINDK